MTRFPISAIDDWCAEYKKALFETPERQAEINAAQREFARHASQILTGTTRPLDPPSDNAQRGKDKDDPNM